MTQQQKNFIESIAKYVCKYMKSYGILVASPIIAQAILESGWGKSSLAAKYHNYFGMKCGSSWRGKSVNLQTAEEYTAGTYTNIKANFRVYDNMEDGVKGYFEFIGYSRYSNLKGVTDPKKYCELIKADGYATSSTYVEKLMNLINTYNLTQYDNVEQEEKEVTIEEIIAAMKAKGFEVKANTANELRFVKAAAAAPTTTLNNGDIVKLKDGCTYYNGQSIPSWVRSKTLYYRGKNKNGLIFSTLKSGAVTGTVKEGDLIKV